MAARLCNSGLDHTSIASRQPGEPLSLPHPSNRLPFTNLIPRSAEPSFVGCDHPSRAVHVAVRVPAFERECGSDQGDAGGARGDGPSVGRSTVVRAVGSLTSGFCPVVSSALAPIVWSVGASSVFLERNQILGPCLKHRSHDAPGLLRFVTADRQGRVAVEHV